MIVFMYLFYDLNALSINATEIIGIDRQTNSSNNGTTLEMSTELEMRTELEMVSSNDEFVVENRDRNR